jgi:hypothetical protein
MTSCSLRRPFRVPGTRPLPPWEVGQHICYQILQLLLPLEFLLHPQHHQHLQQDEDEHEAEAQDEVVAEASHQHLLHLLQGEVEAEQVAEADKLARWLMNLGLNACCTDRWNDSPVSEKTCAHVYDAAV